MAMPDTKRMEDPPLPEECDRRPSRPPGAGPVPTLVRGARRSRHAASRRGSFAAALLCVERQVRFAELAGGSVKGIAGFSQSHCLATMQNGLLVALRRPWLVAVAAAVVVAGSSTAGALTLDRGSADAPVEGSVNNPLSVVPGANVKPPLDTQMQTTVAELRGGATQAASVPTTDVPRASDSAVPEQPGIDLAQLIQGLEPPRRVDSDLQAALIDLDEKADRDERYRQWQSIDHLPSESAVGAADVVPAQSPDLPNPANPDLVY